MGLGLGGRRRAAALALALPLAACGGQTMPVGAAPCPRIAILAEGADLTRFGPGAARDLTAMTVDARIAGFEARCDFAGRDRSALDIRITPRFEAERGPAAPARTADLPWFVVLSDPTDTRDLARVPGSTQISFPANAVRAQVTGRPLQLTLPLAEGERAADYLVRLAFQLTPEELAVNRARGPR